MLSKNKMIKSTPRKNVRKITTISKLTEDDIAAIVLLDIEGYGKDYDLPSITPEEVECFLKAGFILGMKQAGALVSVAIVSRKQSGEWFIYSIVSSPKKRRRGYAELLLKKIISLAKKEKVSRISCVIKPGNEKSLNLFKKNNFKIGELLRDYHGKGKDRLFVSLSNLRSAKLYLV